MHRITMRAVPVIAAGLVLACAATAVAANTLGRKYGYGPATEYTKRAERDTSHSPSTKKRPAVKGKKVYVVTSGMASISSAAPATATMAAAKAIGWKPTLLDGKLNPSTWGGLVNQAVAQGADAIVLVAIDCSAAQAPLKKAKAKKIEVVSIYSYDCSDPISTVKGSSLFTTCVNYQDLDCDDLGDFAQSYGRDQANYIITASKNKAKILELKDDEFSVLRYTSKGFDDQISHSGGAQIVDTLRFTQSDLFGKLGGMVSAELVKHPEITWIKSPYTYATMLGVAPAVAKFPGKYKVMGGEGYPDELKLIQQGQLTAANIIPSEWEGWAAIDALNSRFRDEPTVDSGIGWVIADKSHNVPANATYVPKVNYKAVFKKAWGK